MLDHRSTPYERPRTGLLTVREVAESLAVSLATVRRLVRAGELTRVRIGGSVRFEAADVDALVERGKRLTGGPTVDQTVAAIRPPARRSKTDA